ncbi:MAG: thioredoxin-dependent thiol peroxidase [Deltaproteobacteria bacterium]|nr:thioredoxin-dependent thiol peroxidase [Deltaproteobacteria bacterium]
MAILEAGQQAPDFEIANKDGKKTTLKQFAGQWVVLYFYPKDNTSGCTKEAVAFSQLLEDFKEKNAVVLGVSPDSEKSHQRFAEKHNLKVGLLSDPDHALCEAYGVWQLKKMCGRENMGVVRSTFVINPEGKIEKSWTNVKVDGHAQNVYQTVCELG